MKRFVKFSRWSAQEKRAFLMAWIALAAIRAGMILLPFGALQRLTRSRTLLASQADSTGRAAMAIWAVNAAARWMPGGTCLCRALAAQWLLRREGIDATLRFGAAKIEAEFRAHAWLEGPSGVILGESRAISFTPFPTQQLDAQ